MNKSFDVIIEDCVHCGSHDVRLFKGDEEATGEIFRFDLCLKCDDMVSKLFTSEEACMSLNRIIELNDAKVYGY